MRTENPRLLQRPRCGRGLRPSATIPAGKTEQARRGSTGIDSSRTVTFRIAKRPMPQYADRYRPMKHWLVPAAMQRHSPRPGLQNPRARATALHKSREPGNRSPRIPRWCSDHHHPPIPENHALIAASRCRQRAMSPRGRVPGARGDSKSQPPLDRIFHAERPRPDQTVGTIFVINPAAARARRASHGMTMRNVPHAKTRYVERHLLASAPK